MKKLVAFIFLISSFAQAQFTINGTLTSTIDTDWVLLYKVEGASQKFLQNTTIKKDSVLIDGKKQVINSFNFQLPKETKIGSYRISYRTSGPGFIDFIFNKENIRFAFHPDYPEQTVLFSDSKENIFYKNYLTEISTQQQKLDSLQIAVLQNPELDVNLNYKKTLAKINTIHKKYILETNGMYVQPFIKSNLRANSSAVKTTVKEYMSHITTNFFNNINFSDNTLLNSPFLTDRITDYIFYINVSENVATQQSLYKKSIDTVFSKITAPIFKKDIIEFLIAQFEQTKNLEIIDYLFKNHYDKLPTSLQNQKFKNEKLQLLATEVGRIAPNFSWNENGKKKQLSTLNDAKKYVLVFWSTSCSHCLKEIPVLHKFLQDKKDIKVVAFSLEKDDLGWNNMKKTLVGWHHVLGLNKWENKIARIYNINSTPTYFVLDADKKIIAKPEELKELQNILIEN